jgi:AAA+ superfamily predicted ATPase
MQGDPMGVDPVLLAALIEALQKAPDSVPLRLHVAGLLMQSGGEAAALQHYVTILTKDPASVPALEGAAAAAEAIGDRTRASGYRQLLSALRGAAAEPTPAPAEAKPAPERNEPVAVAREGGESTPWWEVEWPNLRLKDVGGMQQVKRRLDVAFLGPMRNPELRKAYGKSLRGGLLLYGPPGCGKTFIARATAGELGARFLGIGLSDVLDMWFGNSERRLHEIFQHARRSAPCVVFFDELDAIGQKRANLQGAGSMRNVVNQLLAEMDGIGPDNEGVFLLGATNHPWDVDSALLRPGRFDRMALVLPPDEPARVAILEHHLKGKPAIGVDVRAIASKTEGFSGADLAHLCESATELAMEESVTSGKVRSITTADFMQALRQVKPSTRGWFETARNFVLFANQSGTYDDLQEYMRSKKLL